MQKKKYNKGKPEDLCQKEMHYIIRQTAQKLSEIIRIKKDTMLKDSRSNAKLVYNAVRLSR